jgi:hypothetical protein
MQVELPDLRKAARLVHKPAKSSWTASAKAPTRTSGPGDSGTFGIYGKLGLRQPQDPPLQRATEARGSIAIEGASREHAARILTANSTAIGSPSSSSSLRGAGKTRPDAIHGKRHLAIDLCAVAAVSPNADHWSGRHCHI